MDTQNFKLISFYSRLFLGIFFVLTIISFGYVIQQYTYDKLYIYYAGELRVISQRIAKHAGAVVSSASEASFLYLRELSSDFEKVYNILAEGKRDENGEYILPPSPEYIQNHQLKKVDEFWKKIKADVIILLEAKTALQSDYPIMDEVLGAMSRVEDNLLELLKNLAQGKSNQEEMFGIGQQLYYANQLIRDLNLVLTSDKESSAVQKTLPNTADEFINRNTALMAEDVKLRPILTKVDDEFSVVLNKMNDILATAKQLYASTLAYNEIYAMSIPFLEAITSLQQAYIDASQKRNAVLNLAYIFSFVTLILILIQLYIIYRENKLLQLEIQNLVHELGDLAKGNLGVAATGEEGITKAIAEAINYAVNALRKLVVTIDNTAGRVSQSSIEVKRISQEIAEASNKQALEISHAAESVNRLAGSIDIVSGNAEKSAKVSEESVYIAHEGAVLVQKNIQGMNRIKEQILEAEKLMKQLEGSTLEIGDIVSLIRDISDQTNILSINATIQAVEAGDAGKGFSVVADEIQKLATKSSVSSKQIDNLVGAIQLKTQMAGEAMRRSIVELANGVAIAEDSDVALNKIEKVSIGLSELIQNISISAKEQAKVSGSISKLMEVIEAIAHQNATGTETVSNAIGKLVVLVDELYRSVEGFKLPKNNNVKRPEGRFIPE